MNADTTKLLITGDGIHNLVAGSKICTNTTVRKDTIHERGLVTSQFNSSDPENFQAILTSKGEQLTQTSLAALEQKRNKLVKPVFSEKNVYIFSHQLLPLDLVLLSNLIESNIKMNICGYQLSPPICWFDSLRKL